jgi:hypothetical protein
VGKLSSEITAIIKLERGDPCKSPRSFSKNSLDAMPRNRDKKAPKPETEFAMPSGAPAWITPELIRETIAAWQPFYDESLTADDGYTILLNVGRLFAVLSRS